MNRRQFLRAAAATTVAPLVLPNVVSGDETSADKLILSAPLTHSDWILKPGVAWGEAGVRHMLDMCKAAGWSRVHWRVFDGGKPLYHTPLMKSTYYDEDSFWNPQSPADKELATKFGVTEPKRQELLAKFAKLDYAHFDTLKAAVDYGHQIGLQIWAWASINEDDHGWGLGSDFAKAHPQFRWTRKDGRPYITQLSYAFKEVRDYKLALLKDLLDRYAIDGLFLDWIRTGDVRDNPQNDANGIANYGYETPNLEAFKSKTGKDAKDVAPDDENWLRVKAEPQTVFMRDVRKLAQSYKDRAVPLCALVGHPWHYRGFGDKIAGNLKGLNLDTEAWADEGLVDSIVAAGYFRDGGTPEMAYKALKDETGGKLDVWTYAWVPQNVGEFDRDYNLAKSLGAKQILFWEADYIDDRGNAAELKKAMTAKSKW